MKVLYLLVLILSLGSFSGYSQTKCRHITAPDSPLINIEPKNEDHLIKVTLTDPVAPQFYAEGRVREVGGRNVLTLAFLMKNAEGERSEILKGKESLKKIIQIIEKKGIRIDAFSSMWNDHFRDYDGPSDNLMDFMRAYRDSFVKSTGSLSLPENIDYYISPGVEASLHQAAEVGAWSTWTGKQMKDLGFNYIEEVQIIETSGYRGADGSPNTIDIRAVWTKKKSQEGFYLNAVKDKGKKSTLPRFHLMIHSMSKYFDRTDK